MGVITVAIFIALVISVILTVLRKAYDKIHGLIFRAPSTIQSPPAYPFLRHFPYFWTSFQVIKMITEWAKLFKKEGIFSFDPMLGPERIVIFKEEYLKQVLVTNCYKYARPKDLTKVFPKISGGLFSSNGKEHAWQRKILNPAFSLSSVAEYTNTFDKHVDNLIAFWKSKTEKALSAVAEIDVHTDCSRLTLDVIGVTAFGYNFDTLISGENEISIAVETILKGRTGVFKRAMRRLIPFYDDLPFSETIGVKNAEKITDAVVAEVIKRRRENLKQQQNENVDIGKDLLAKMMRMQDEETGRQMTDGILHAQVYTFMIAGHETTSVGLTWTLYLLAKHQEIQAKAREEAKAVLGDSVTMTNKQLDSLTYITAVINESLRMYPPAALFLRETIQEDKIGGHVIPNGSFIVIPICILHHMEEYWPNPDKFIPERFLKTDDSKPDISNYKFMPFSAGPRNCIGRKFSMAEMKITIAKLLYTFKFELDPNHPELTTRLQLTLKPHPKPILRVTLLEE